MNFLPALQHEKRTKCGENLGLWNDRAIRRNTGATIVFLLKILRTVRKLLSKERLYFIHQSKINHNLRHDTSVIRNGLHISHDSNMVHRLFSFWMSTVKKVQDRTFTDSSVVAELFIVPTSLWEPCVRFCVSHRIQTSFRKHSEPSLTIENLRNNIKNYIFSVLVHIWNIRLLFGRVLFRTARNFYYLFCDWFGLLRFCPLKGNF